MNTRTSTSQNTFHLNSSGDCRETRIQDLYPQNQPSDNQFHCDLDSIIPPAKDSIEILQGNAVWLVLTAGCLVCP